MDEEASTDTVYTDGKIYTYSIILTEPGDDYTYWFWARDNLGIEAEGPATNVMSVPRVFGAIPPEFIVSRINNSIYYFPYDETTNTFGSPVLIDDLGPCTGSPKSTCSHLYPIWEFFILLLHRFFQRFHQGFINNELNCFYINKRGFYVIKKTFSDIRMLFYQTVPLQ